MSITREEYNKALDIVEAYHKQILFNIENGDLRSLGKTHLKDWNNYKNCSQRLKNVLHDAFHGKWAFTENIEDIDIRQLRKSRGAGKKTINEFIKLRGF